jgi:hypothetical protein
VVVQGHRAGPCSSARGLVEVCEHHTLYKSTDATVCFLPGALGAPETLAQGETGDGTSRAFFTPEDWVLVFFNLLLERTSPTLV